MNCFEVLACRKSRKIKWSSRAVLGHLCSQLILRLLGLLSWLTCYSTRRRRFVWITCFGLRSVSCWSLTFKSTTIIVERYLFNRFKPPPFIPNKSKSESLLIARQQNICQLSCAAFYWRELIFVYIAFNWLGIYMEHLALFKQRTGFLAEPLTCKAFFSGDNCFSIMLLITSHCREFLWAQQKWMWKWKLWKLFRHLASSATAKLITFPFVLDNKRKR